MFEEKIRFIIQEKYIDLVSLVIDELKNLPVASLTNALETTSMPFDNVWDAFASLSTRWDEVLDYACSQTISDICCQTVQTLTLTELKLLWVISEGAIEWGSESFPEVEQMIEEVTDELFSWVEQEAEEPEL